MKLRYDQGDAQSRLMELRDGQQQWSNILRCERKRRCWSQVILAEKIGATAISVSRWESGKVFPQPQFCRELCRVLEMHLEELFPEGSERGFTKKIHTKARIPTNRLKQARQQRGLSQAELGKELDVARGLIARWESERGSPNFYHLRKLCRFFKVSPGYLFPDAILKSIPLTDEETKETETSPPKFDSSGQRFFDF